jgi:hypothetical protein
VCRRCIRQTPTGYRCNRCIGQHQQVFESLLWRDYARVGAISAVLSGVPALIVFIPIICGFVTIMSPVLGWIVASAAFEAARQRLGRYLPLATGAGIALGGLTIVLISAGTILFADLLGPVPFADRYIAMFGALGHIGLCWAGAWLRFQQLERK